MKKPIMLFTSKDAIDLSKKDLDNVAVRTSLIKTLRWYESDEKKDLNKQNNKKYSEVGKDKTELVSLAYILVGCAESIKTVRKKINDILDRFEL